MKATISKTLLLGLAVPDGKAKLRIFDDRLRGFIAEQRATGTTFYFRYADDRHRTREVKLGRHGDVTVEQARRQAERLRSQVSLGTDPLAERDKRRAVPTVEEFALGRYMQHVNERLLSADCNERYLRLRILPAIGRKRLDEVTQADVSALRAGMVEKGLSPSTVNRHLACLRAMFNCAIKWQVLEGRNPAASPGMLRERQRDRYLSGVETRALIAALDKGRCRQSAAAIVLLAVTGARKQEVLRATWDNVDFDRALLTVPRAKSGKPRHIPLSPFAVAVLRRQLAKRVDDCPWVFPSPRDAKKPIGHVRKVWDRAKRDAGLPADLHIHDLRHSFASALANAGIPLFEIGSVLGRTQLSTTQRYAHHAPARLVATATAAASAWDLVPAA